MSTINDILARDGAAAEDAPTPDSGTRPNRGRSVMFSIRLNPDELDQLERRAENEGVPARTLARAWILRALNDEAADLGERVRRLEDAVFKRTA